MPSDHYMLLIQYTPEQIATFNKNYSVIARIDASSFPLVNVIDLNYDVLVQLNNDKVRNLLATNKTVDLKRLVQLTPSQISHITKHNVITALSLNIVTLAEALEMRDDLLPAELLQLRATENLKFHAINTIFSALSPKERETLACFNYKFITTYLVLLGMRDPILKHIVAMNNTDRSKLQLLNPEVLAMIFEHNRLTIKQALALTKEGKDYIVRAYNDPHAKASLITGECEQYYLPYDNYKDLEFLARLKGYLNYVEQCPIKADGKRDFGHLPFRIPRLFKDSQAANREANYNLTVTIHGKLKAAMNNGEKDALAKAFAQDVLASRNGTVRSLTLKAILDDAKRYTGRTELKATKRR
mgnify:FL=1